MINININVNVNNAKFVDILQSWVGL